MVTAKAALILLGARAEAGRQPDRQDAAFLSYAPFDGTGGDLSNGPTAAWVRDFFGTTVTGATSAGAIEQ